MSTFKMQIVDSLNGFPWKNLYCLTNNTNKMQPCALAPCQQTEVQKYKVKKTNRINK